MLIERAEVYEISLMAEPANPHCVIEWVQDGS
jgi:hypothetical protein